MYDEEKAEEASAFAPRHRRPEYDQQCGSMTLGADDLTRPCILEAGHAGYHSTGRP